MPPRFAYWTIILEGKPTAFRAQQKDELLPTLKQLQTRHPDVVMKWFGRGKLWDSPEEAQAAQRGGPRERRSPSWRPGGEHRDPRERFKVPRDVKRRRFAERQRTEGGGSTQARGRPFDGRGGGDRDRRFEDRENRVPGKRGDRNTRQVQSGPVWQRDRPRWQNAKSPPDRRHQDGPEERPRKKRPQTERGPAVSSRAKPDRQQRPPYRGRGGRKPGGGGRRGPGGGGGRNE